MNDGCDVGDSCDSRGGLLAHPLGHMDMGVLQVAPWLVAKSSAVQQAGRGACY